MARALAAALVCTAGEALGCGQCSACRRALTLSEEAPQVPLHPDVVLLERGLYPPSLIGRSSPETMGIGVEQVRRLVLSRAQYPPHEARSLVFIIRRADELTVSAANALLKTLEEPARDVYFLLLTHRPRRLLDTIRSRTLPIRFGPLSTEAIARILADQDVQADAQLLAMAAGSAARALQLAGSDDAERRRSLVQRLPDALGAADLGPSLDLIAAMKPDRASLERDLPTLLHHFADSARSHTAHSRFEQARTAANRYAETAQAMLHSQRNMAPALVMETLLARLRRC